MKKWTFQDTSHANYLGSIEFQDNQQEFYNFEVFNTEKTLIFGGFTNNGFLESGYMEKDSMSINEALQELLSDLEVYYNDGKQFTGRIICNERM